MPKLIQSKEKQSTCTSFIRIDEGIGTMKAVQVLLVFGDIPRPLGQGGEVGVAPLVDGSLHSFKAGKDKTRSQVLLAV